MWWILGVAVVVILIVVIATVASLSNRNSGDYNDGGGTQVGGDENIPFFATANDRAGMLGERAVNNHLRQLLRQDEFILANVLLPRKNGYKTEIDCVLISRKGVFCIETKTWVGHISGSDDDEFWYQVYDDPYMDDREHKNPVKQNESHCVALERALRNKYRVDNVVILVDFDDGYGIQSDYAYSISEFKHYYRELDDNELDIFQVKAIYQTLLPYVASSEELNRYKEEIQKKT